MYSSTPDVKREYIEKQTNKRPFLNHIHYFRALAIIFVVAAHINIDKTIYIPVKTIAILDILQGPFFHNGTVLFVFISGFLFQYLSYNFNYKEYLTKKFKYVILPYLLISFPFIITKVAIYNYTIIMPHFFNNSNPVCKIIYMMFTGQACGPFWYIPFIAVMFLFAPFWLFIIKNNSNYFLLLFLIIPFYFPRDAYLTLNNYLYFFPIYLTGMFVASDYGKFSQYFKKYKLLFLTISFVLLYFESICKYTESIQLYLNLWQKLFFSFAALGFFTTIENTKSKLITSIADYSFSIFFFHSFIFYHIINRLISPELFYSFNYYILWFLCLILTFSTTYCFSMLLKKILGNKSRYIIGV